jgi:hypothetical protein
VGPLEADEFYPNRVLAAMVALQALGREGAAAALRDYLATRREPPSGLFAVIRGLFMPPEGSVLRPPALGAPVPAQPDAVLPRFPLVMLDDVPLSVVRGYQLGGLPESVGMHLDYLLSTATWRSAPLEPGAAGSVRYLLIHWGQWVGTELAPLLETQLVRYEAGR